MSHRALNPEQFAETAQNIHPHQLAIPGTEHLSHPWAGPLSQGYMLDYARSKHEHHLSAVDVSHPKYPHTAAELNWLTKKATHPGEVSWVENIDRDPDIPEEKHDPRAKGLAGALFHSAHHWNFGQDTVPIHSPLRSDAGERFASKVRPDLKPDVWEHSRTHEMKWAEGKRPYEKPTWPGVGPEFHPFQREIMAKRGGLEGMRARRRAASSGQGKLF
jgi:hypothetical protein